MRRIEEGHTGFSPQDATVLMDRFEPALSGENNEIRQPEWGGVDQEPERAVRTTPDQSGQQPTLKICCFGNAASIHTRRWVTYFSIRGFDVTLISVTPGIVPGVHMHVLGSSERPRKWDYLRSTLKARRIVRTLAPDIVHVHYAGGYGVMGALIGWHPLITTVWGSELLVVARRSWLLRKVVQWILRSADLVTCTAQMMVGEIEQLGIDRSRIEMIPFGVDTAIFHSCEILKPGLNEALTVVSTRALEPIYCVEVFLDALSKVLARFKNARAVIVGNGMKREALEARVKELGIADRVRFEGAVAPERMSEILQAADIYVSTSPTDTNHVSLNEAMACGAFPVVTNIPANREWLSDGETGLLVKPKDSDDLAEKLVRALEDRGLRTRAAARNRETVELRASFQGGMEANERLYRSLASRKFEMKGRRTAEEQAVSVPHRQDQL